MPSAKPQIPLRAEPDQFERWRAAAVKQGDSLNAFVAGAADAAAAFLLDGESGKTTPSSDISSDRAPSRRKRASAKACPRERFHRPGSYCKFCDTTPAARP